MASNNAEVLERLLIEVVGDDSKLKAALEATVKHARQAADQMRDALAIDLSRLQTDAKATERAFEGMGSGLGDFGQVIEAQLKHAERAFEKVRGAGEKSEEQFEEYRRTALEALDVLRPFVGALGASGRAFDDLAKHVKEAKYEQSEVAKETQKTQQAQEDLAATIERLSNEVRSSRNVWAGRITSDDEFRQSTSAAREELLKLLATVDRGSKEYRKLSQELAYAQRGLDSVNKVASRGGLAWTAQIALANQFGQTLRGLGPAGGAAATALGFVGGAFGSLQAPLTMADFHLTKVLASLSRFAFIVAPMAAGLGAIAGAAGLGALTLSAAKAARELENATYRTGLTIEGLQELQHAARSTGIPLELLSTTMQRLQRRAADANAGNAGLAQAFRQLGVTLTDNEGRMRSTEDLLGQVADGLNRVENNADRLALAFKIFDTEGGRLLPLLAEGSEGIKRLREEARELGLVVSGDTIMSLSQFQSEVETVKRQFEVLKIEVGAAFLPLMRDVFIPLLQDAVIPWLQNAAQAVDNFSDAFFDTSEAGEAFRADTIKNLQAVIMLGRGVVAAAAAVAGAVQSILGIGAGAFGAGEGLRRWATTTGKDLEIIRDQRAQIVESIAQQEQQLADLLAGRLPEGYPEGAVPRAIEQLEANIAAARARLEEFDRLYPQGFIGAVVSGAEFRAENLMGGALDSFQVMLDVLEADIPAMIEAWAAGIAPRVNRAARTIGDGVGTGIGDGVEKALPGSIAFAREKVQEFTKAFDNAVTDEARRIADEQRQHWQGVLDALLAPFQPVEATAAAKLWTDRLSAELRAGIKKPIEVFNLLTQGIATAQERLENARLEFGFDSQEYRDALAGLQFLESWLTQFQRDFATEPITVTVTAEVAPVRGLLPDLTLPEQTKTAAQALTEFYTRLTRVADQQAKLTGATEDTRAAWVETLEVLESILPGLDEMSDDWLLVTTLILQARARVEELDEELGGASVTTTGLVGALQRAAIAARDLWDSAQGSTFASELTGVVGAVTGFIGVTAGLRKGGLLAAFLGEDFDATATEISLLEAEVRSLVERYDDLSFAERLRLAVASTRLKALKDQRQAEEDAADAVEDHTLALEEWLAAVAKIGVSEDPLLARARQLEAWLDEGVITLDEYQNMLTELAAAQDRLASGLDPAAFDAWAQGVGRLGVELDPVTLAAADLARLMDEGKITAEQYAAGLELVADALDRIEQSEADKQVEKVTKAWEAAGAQLADALGVDLFDVVTSQWDEMRKAAEAAFDAGIIGADELAKALQVIGILEVADGFRQVAAELGEVAGIVPNLAADLTEAFAMFTAGNTAGGIATAFQAATAAVRGLGEAFEDEARRGEAALDLLIGGAAALATALGGPALGQAVAAVGEFVKSVLGDLSNGLAEIDKQVRETASRSQWLGEGLVRGIAEGATRQVSRGGLLGLLGFTKAALDEDAFRAGITVAEGLASGLVNTLRSGDFEEAWNSFIDDILVQGVIEAFMATALVQDAIQEAMELIMGGDAAGGAAALDRLKNDFHAVWQTIQSITTTPLPSQDDLERSVTFSLPDATVSVLAAPQWALELVTAAERMSEAGSAMLTAADMMQDTLSRPLTVELPPASRGIDAARSI